MIVTDYKSYRTRCGFEVEIYAIYPNQTFPVHGAYKKNADQIWYCTAWGIDGKYHPATGSENYLDLVEVPNIPIKLAAAFQAMAAAEKLTFEGRQGKATMEEIRIASGHAFIKALLDGMAEDPLSDPKMNDGYQGALRQVLERAGIPQE